MPFNHLNTNFDNLFDPYVSGTKTCPAGEYILAGQDIRDRYAPLSVGSKRANVGYRINGTDITNYFAAKGTAVYWDGTLEDISSEYFESASQSQVDSTPTIPVLSELLFDPNGNIRYRKNYPTQETIIGTWDGAIANSGNSEIRVVPLSGDAPNSYPASFVPLTSTRAVSYQTFSGSRSGTYRIELRQNGNAATTVTKDVIMGVQVISF